jgi:MtN3 and saliva related transmembrane protein
MLQNYFPLADSIGIVAGVLVLSSFIPQVIKAYKTKRMIDVSIYLLGLISTGMFLWIIYGILRNDLVIIGTNVSGFVLNVLLIGLKLRYDKQHKK